MGEAALRPAPLEPLEGVFQDSPPPPFAGLCPQLLSRREGPGSRLLIGACDPNLSRPGKLRSWAWLRGGAGPQAQNWFPSWLSSSLSCLFPPRPPSPLSSQSFYPGLGLSPPPQLFLFPNCTVWPVATRSVGAGPDWPDLSTVPNRALLGWMGVGFLRPDCQGQAGISSHQRLFSQPTQRRSTPSPPPPCRPVAAPFEGQ